MFDFAMSKIHRLPRPLRFGAVGGSCAVVQLAALYVYVRLGLPKDIANAVGFITSAQLNFVLSSFITWRDRFTGRLELRGLAGRLALFNAMALFGLAVNQLTFEVALTFAGYLLAGALGILVTAGLTYIISGRLVFRRTSSFGPVH